MPKKMSLVEFKAYMEEKRSAAAFRVAAKETMKRSELEDYAAEEGLELTPENEHYLKTKYGL